MAGGGDFGDDVFEGGCGGEVGPGAGGVTDGAEAHGHFLWDFVGLKLNKIGHSHDHPVTNNAVTFMGEVEIGQRNLFGKDVLPHVHFGPITQREDPEMFTEVFAAVEDIPQFGTLVFGIPLAEFVAVGKEALFGAGFFFVAASAAHGRIVAALFQAFQQHIGLQSIPTGTGTDFFFDLAAINRFLHRPDHQFGTHLGHELIAVGHGFREVMSGVHMHQGKGNLGRPKSFLGQMGHHNRILAAGKQHHRFVKLRRGFAENVDGFGLELF